MCVEVPLADLPEAVRPLAAGIDPQMFRAHHLGLPITSFSKKDGALRFERSESFALIDYQSPGDQHGDGGKPFCFKVQRLSVSFRNGEMSAFSSRAQLFVNRVFGAPAMLYPSEHGNNLILNGFYQIEEHAGDDRGGTYIFSLENPCAFQLKESALAEMSVEGLRMGIVEERQNDLQHGETSVFFQLAGCLKFIEPEGFDPFCWGDTGGDSGSGLPYSGYVIRMTFSSADPSNAHFSVQEGNLTLHPAQAHARPLSLYSCFPLHLTGLMASQTSDAKPETFGFVSISTPLSQGKLSAPWFGLVYDLDIGTLGAMASAAGLSLRLLAAWNPCTEEHDAALYIGAALPGSDMLSGLNLPLQGIMTLGFKSLQFSAYDQEKDGSVRRQYILRFRDFGLHVLGFSFPPGHNDISLFGNPDKGNSGKLGWYAAYDNGLEIGKKSAIASGQMSPEKGNTLPPPKAVSGLSPDTARIIRLGRPARRRTARSDVDTD
jgi:hypothetical protein